MTQKVPAMVADVTIVGAGIIGLSTALAIADRGVSVRLIGTTHRGEASSASAGMLTPSVEEELRDVFNLAIEAREMYPSFLADLEERTQIPVPLNRRGALRIAITEEDAESLKERVRPGVDRWLDANELRDLEPALQHAVGALFTPNDGCVDPLLLLDALRLAVARNKAIEVVSEDVSNIDVSEDTCETTTDRAGRYVSQMVVLAAGAWSPSIVRSGYQLPVEPVRGQIIAYAERPLQHVTYGPRGYAVPKADGHTMVGSTFERVGFHTDVTDEGIATLQSIGGEICPALATASVDAMWAGLRPITPDMLPIIGPDPESPNIIFSCGHSRNGILLTPLSAQVVADFVTNKTPRYDVHRFRPERF
jgi:glycine oxidase